MKTRLEKLKTFIDNDDNLNYTVAMSLLDDALEELTEDVATYKTVANVTFNPAAGAVTIGTTVALATTTADADIHYTLDGSIPDSTDPVYTAPIPITTAKTIKAIAYKNYQNAATVQSAAYTISVVATPTATPGAGAVSSGTTIALASATSGATIYYTTNGDTPTNASTLYTEAIEVTEAMTIKAIAYKTNYNPSAVLTADYTIQE